MNNIYELRDSIEEFVSRYELWIKGACRFFVALLALSAINARLGYMERLNSMTMVVAVALLCALIPAGATAFFCSAFIVLHCYALSLEAAITVLALFLLMFLLYFRFTPNDTMAVLFTPLSFIFRIPHVMPVIYGLKGSPLSALSVGFGVIAYYAVDFVSSSADTIKGMKDATTVERFRFILDGLMRNKEMVVYVIAFAATVVVVSIIRRLSVKHAWSIAIGSGLLVDVILLVILGARSKLNLNIAGILLGILLSAAISFIFKLFVFSVDYARTERVQFEDDGFYYYVKAVPKIRSRKRKRHHELPAEVEE